MNLKKIISVLLVIALFITTFSCTVFAKESTTGSFSIVAGEEENPSNPEEEASKEFNEEEWGNAPVVRVYLCLTVNSFTGHVWLYFVNLTPYELPLGYVTLQPYEEMSVGSLRNTRKDGGGTYYNGEAFMADDLNSVGRHTRSIYEDINYDQLKTIGKKITSRNSYILLFDNCGDFACACWNTIAPSGKKVVNVLVPLFTAVNLAIVGGKKNQIVMKRPDISRTFKQTKNGIKQADEKSFRASCVNW